MACLAERGREGGREGGGKEEMRVGGRGGPWLGARRRDGGRERLGDTETHPAMRAVWALSGRHIPHHCPRDEDLSCTRE